jgi:hypothetical protein
MATKYAKRVKKGIKKVGAHPMKTYLNDPLDDIKKYKSVGEFGKDYPELEAITVTATRTKPTLESQVIEEIRVTRSQTPREKRIEARREKRAAIKKINRQARVDRLEAKMETAEQKRDPYRHGGLAKPN